MCVAVGFSKDRLSADCTAGRPKWGEDQMLLLQQTT